MSLTSRIPAFNNFAEVVAKFGAGSISSWKDVSPIEAAFVKIDLLSVVRELKQKDEASARTAFSIYVALEGKIAEFKTATLNYAGYNPPEVKPGRISGADASTGFGLAMGAAEAMRALKEEIVRQRKVFDDLLFTSL